MLACEGCNASRGGEGVTGGVDRTTSKSGRLLSLILSSSSRRSVEPLFTTLKPYAEQAYDQNQQ